MLSRAAGSKDVFLRWLEQRLRQRLLTMKTNHRLQPRTLDPIQFELEAKRKKGWKVLR